MTPNERLKEALDSLGIIQVVTDEYVEEASQVRVLFRVVGDHKAWLPVVDAILAEEERLGDGCPWNVHICKNYMRHNNRLVYAWNLTVQFGEGGIDDICRLLMIMAKHVQVFRQKADLQRKMQNGVLHAVPTDAMDKPVRTPRSRNGDLPGTGLGGIMHNGEVVEMPLVGATESRNEPQAPLMTPGVRGMGRGSGVSSKGAHFLVTK
jgi:hypothetical protein